MLNFSKKKVKSFSSQVMAGLGIAAVLISILSFGFDGIGLQAISLKSEEVSAMESGGTASLRICKLITDDQGVIVNGADLPIKTYFTLQGPLRPIYASSDSISPIPTTVFQTPLNLNTDLLGNDGVNDAQCVTYQNLPFSNYFFDWEGVSGNDLSPSKYYIYKHQIESPVLSNFEIFSNEWYTQDTADDNTHPRSNGLVDMYPGGGAESYYNQTVIVWSSYLPNQIRNQPPTLTLLGANPLNLNQGASFTDQGATATDPEEGNLTSQIKVKGSVNINVVGTYPLTYSVHDSGGLGATTTRNVIVQAIQPSQTANLRVCKIITDTESKIINGQGLTGSFTLSGPTRALYLPSGTPTTSVPTTVFQTPLNLNTDLLGNDGVNDAQCVTYSNLPVNHYFFDREIISGSNWLEPKYFVYLQGEVVDLTNLDIFYDDWYNTDPSDNLAHSRRNGLIDMHPAGGPVAMYNQTLVVWNRYQAPQPVNQPPVITLLGANPLNLNQGASFTDPGATATDPEDGNLTNKVKIQGSVNTSVPGNYPVTYSVHDSGGLGATTTRNVIVQAPVNQPPVITLLGANPLMVMKGSSYSDPGATATDLEDGDLTSQIKRVGEVNAFTAGTYQWTYSVHDSGGLGATTTRDVTVYHTTPTSTPQCSDGIDNDGDGKIDSQDPTCHSDKDPNNPLTYNPNKNTENEAPVITLTGSPTMTIPFGSSFVDPGATALDFEDGDLTLQIVKSGDTVNTSNAGPYTIRYNVKDSQGLSAEEKTRIVTVQEQSHSGGGGGGGSVLILAPSLIITNEAIQQQGIGQVIITWETNDPADSKVVYGTSSVIDLKAWNLDYGYPLVTEINTNLKKNHSVVIFGLDPSQKYYFRPVSNNPQSNPAVGKQLIWPTETTIAPPVIGECNYLLEYLKIGQVNNPLEVIKLQNFLNQFYSANLVVNGFFDQATFEAVKKFQAKYFSEVLAPWGHIEPTGYVYITTKKKVNEIYCQRPFPLTSNQEQEIKDFRRLLESWQSSPSAWPETQPVPKTDEVGYGTEEPFWPDQEEILFQTEPTDIEDEEVMFDETGLVAEIEKDKNDDESSFSALGLAGMGTLITGKTIYWFALILMVLILGSVVFYFRAKRRQEIPYSVPPFPDNIPVK